MPHQLTFVESNTYSIEKIHSGAIFLAVASTFGQNLKAARKRAKLKAYQVAERLGVQPPVVSKWENDKSGLPETPTLFRLAKAVGASIEDLLRGIDPEYDELASSLVHRDAHRDLSSQTSTGPSPSTSRTKGDVEHVQAEDLARSVEPREAELRQTLLDIASTILNQLGTEVIDDVRGAAGAPVPEAELRRRHRTVGSG